MNYVSVVGHPYLWAQWLCGLQFLVESHTLQKSQTPLLTSQMEETIRRLRHRIQTRLALQKQLSVLGLSNGCLDRPVGGWLDGSVGGWLYIICKIGCVTFGINSKN